MSETKALTVVAIEETDIERVFCQDGLREIIDRIERDAKSIRADISTKAGRETIVSAAYAVTKSKTGMDRCRKQLLADLNAKVKSVNDAWRPQRDRLDALADEIRAPVTQWEREEEERKGAIRADIDDIKNLPHSADDVEGLRHVVCVLEGVAIEADKYSEFLDEATAVHSNALMVAKDRLQAAEKAEADRLEIERLRKEKEEREAKEAAERAKREAEEKAKAEAERIAKAEQERKEREEQIAKEAAEQAKREAAEREEKLAREKAELEARLKKEEEDRKREESARIKREAEEAKAKVEREKRLKEEAAQAERDRTEAERKAKEEADAKRKADEAHRDKVKGEALDDIQRLTDAAPDVLLAIEQGKIRHVTLNF